jgi:hypothetical protein
MESNQPRADAGGGGLEPRADVGGGGLAGALSVLLMVVFEGEIYDFNAFVAAIVAIIVFLAGYLPSNYKSFFTAAAASIAVIIATIVSYTMGGQIDKAAVSGAIAAVAVALVTYLGPPRDPEEPEVVTAAATRT